MSSERAGPAETAVDATEISELRARVADLEDQLQRQSARTNDLVARAQDRVYWLDRWHLDLNAVMARPGADLFRRSLRAARAVMRRARALKRRILR
jgi:hypothetical protein